jgi:hypothetical protein
VIVPASDSIGRRQQQAARRLRKTGSLEGMFTGDMQSWQYGVASAMVDLMIRRDAQAFRLFFEGIKEGLSWEESLERAFSATPDDLIALYANSIGMPHLTP